MTGALVLTAIAVLALLVGEARGPKWLPWIAKPIASLGFVWAAWACRPDDAAGWTIVVGLWLCLVGDVCLLSRGKGAFLAGLGAFFLGHVAYAIAFGQRGLAMPTTIATAAVLVVPAVVVWRWLRSHVEPAMRVPVLAYIVAITIMVACAIGSAGPRGEWLTITGAVAFYLSDISVARDVFVHRSFTNRLWGLPLYYAAQLCLAATV
jgi:uncharacterized membrane protein YhhN